MDMMLNYWTKMHDWTKMYWTKMHDISICMIDVKSCKWKCILETYMHFDLKLLISR